MSIIKHNSSFLLVTIVLIVILVNGHSERTTLSKSNPKTRNLHLKLIHIDSPDSPMYRPELTDFERAQRLLAISESRMDYLANNNTKQRVSEYREPDVTSEIKKEGAVYYVEIGLGQFGNSNPPFHKTYLIFDTGSDVIWTECEGCRPCSQQRIPLFPKSRSQTYQPLVCRACPGGQCRDHCVVEQRYTDGAKMKGVWAHETFTFTSSLSYFNEKVNRIKFACATETQNFQAVPSPNSVLTGILGMNAAENSLISQLGTKGIYQFSYCLQSITTRAGGQSPMLLSFGESITRPPTMSVTPILRNHKRDYYVSLRGISVNNKRLNIPENVFALKPDYSGGTCFDSGSSTSHIVPSAFDILKEAVTTYVRKNNAHLKRYSNHNFHGLEACWVPLKDSPRVVFPTMTYHFENNANLVVQPSQLISILAVQGVPQPGVHCMTVVRAKHDLNIIGAKHQINQRVIINVRTSQLFFAPTDCSRTTG